MKIKNFSSYLTESIAINEIEQQAKRRGILLSNGDKMNPKFITTKRNGTEAVPAWTSNSNFARIFNSEADVWDFCDVLKDYVRELPNGPEKAQLSGFICEPVWADTLEDIYL